MIPIGAANCGEAYLGRSALEYYSRKERCWILTPLLVTTFRGELLVQARSYLGNNGPFRALLFLDTGVGSFRKEDMEELARITGLPYRVYFCGLDHLCAPLEGVFHRMELGEARQRLQILQLRVQEAEERYRPLVEGIGDVIYEEFMRLKVRGALESIVHPADAPRLFEALEQVSRGWLEGERVPFHFEYRIIRSDGSIIWVSDRRLPLFEGDGQVRAIGSLRDITQTRRAEERSRELAALNAIATAVHRSLELEEVYRLALDAVVRLVNLDVVGIYLVDEDTREAVLQAQRGFSEDYVRRAGRIKYPKGVT